MKSKRFEMTEEMVSNYDAKLRKWFHLLNEIMPDYFFNTFTAKEFQDILPALFNIRHDSGIQQLHRGNTIILIYLKSGENNLVKTAEFMKKYDIIGASIHEAKEKIIIDGIPSTLVIECYETHESGVKMTPSMSKKELEAAYRHLYGKVPSAIGEIYDRINWNVVSDLDGTRLAERVHYAVQVQSEDRMILDVKKVDKGEIRLTMALSNCPAKGFYYKYIETLANHGFQVQRAYLRKLTLNTDYEEFAHMPVSVNTLYLKSDKKTLSVKSPQVVTVLNELPHIKWVPMDDLFHQELVISKGWLLSEANLLRAAGEFVHTQLSFVDRHAYNNHDIFRLMALYEPLLRDLLAYFDATFNRDHCHKEQLQKRRSRKIRREIDNINTGTHEKDIQLKTIFHCLLNFFANILKTNYYIAEKSSLSFRLNPEFMTFYDQTFPGYKQAFPAERPFGIFYFFRESGIGFHIRFSKIARGGWRTVIPKQQGHHLEQMDAYAFAKDEIFREVFVLAHTQHMKNKDIYEGGSKMICLLKNTEANPYPFLFEVQRSICRAFLDLINYDRKGRLRDDRVVDIPRENEIIEIGPDENMFDTMINWISTYATESGYCLEGGLISGKPDRGINHKEYGVTSYGVHQFLLKTLKELTIDPEKDPFTIKISGGPYGDVAGNELKLLLQKKGKVPLYPAVRIIAITDGPAAAYDPDGLNKQELKALIHKKGLDAFNPDMLTGEKAYIIYSEPIDRNGKECYRLICRKNRQLRETFVSRDEYMRIFQQNLLDHYADVFIPCGGRPATINEANWDLYLQDGKPSSKAIIEGANSFITPEARHHLQDAGVWIIKDASANKCGVITSSYEILTGLMLTVDDYHKYKSKLIREIMDILKERAGKEANWLFERYHQTGTMLTELTEQLSRKINAKNVAITAYLQSHPELVTSELILAHLPKFMATLDPAILKKIPQEYKEAVVAVELASRIVYNLSHNIEDEIATILQNRR